LSALVAKISAASRSRLRDPKQIRDLLQIIEIGRDRFYLCLGQDVGNRLHDR
jgi:hypothetical protein